MGIIGGDFFCLVVDYEFKGFVRGMKTCNWICIGVLGCDWNICGMGG